MSLYSRVKTAIIISICIPLIIIILFAVGLIKANLEFKREQDTYNKACSRNENLEKVSFELSSIKFLVPKNLMIDCKPIIHHDSLSGDWEVMRFQIPYKGEAITVTMSSVKEKIKSEKYEVVASLERQLPKLLYPSENYERGPKENIFGMEKFPALKPDFSGDIYVARDNKKIEYILTCGEKYFIAEKCHSLGLNIQPFTKINVEYYFPNSILKDHKEIAKIVMDELKTLKSSY